MKSPHFFRCLFTAMAALSTLIAPRLQATDPAAGALLAPTNETSLPLVFLLEVKPHAAEEGPEAGQLLVVRFGDTNSALAVAYEIGGTAVNEVDYQPLLGRVRIPAGANVAPIVVTPIDDNLPEPRESVIIQLTHPAVDNLANSGPAAYRVGYPSRAVLGIQDNDEAENHPPTVSLINPPDGAVLRGPLDLHLTALADDPDGRVEFVEFFAGQHSLGVASNLLALASTTADLAAGDIATLPTGVNVIVTNLTSPPVLPPIAPFYLTWTNAPPGEHAIRAVATDNRGARSESRVTRIRIEADTALPRVNIVARDEQASESDSADGQLDTATLVVRRSGDTATPLTVGFRLSGTATVGEDYDALTTSVTIPAGAREAEIVITPIDDKLEEPRESVLVELQPIACIEIFPPPPGCYELGDRPRAAVWIEDNDRVITNRPPLVEIVRPEQNAILVTPDAYLLVANAQDFDGWVEAVEFFDGDLSLGVVTNRPSIFADPVPAAGAPTSILPPWSLNWTNIAPGSHLLRAVATDNLGATRSSRGVEVLVVESNSLPVVTIHAPDGQAAEPDSVAGSNVPQIDTGRFRVTRTGPTTRPLTAFFHVAGSAGNGTDYAEVPSQVTIPEGHDGADILVRPKDDALDEGPESVVLSLRTDLVGPLNGTTAPSRYIIGNPFRAEVMIRDNDTGVANRPPEAVILSPATGAVIRLQEEFRIAVHARDVDGHVVRLEGFANGQKFADETIRYFETPPDGMRETFTLAWTNMAPGEHRLRVRVTDNDGEASHSEPVDVKVIEEHEQTVVSIAAADPDAAEGGNVGVFRVSRRGNLNHEVHVPVRLAGSAAHGADYHVAHPETTGVVSPPLPPSDNTSRETLSLVFGPGQTERVIVVEPVDDDLVEQAETVVATIDPPVCIAIFPPPPDCYRIGESARATVVIRDNDENRNRTPRVVIASPGRDQKFTAPADIEIAVHTRDADGWVSQMEFFAGERKIGDSVVHFIRPPDPSERQRFSLVWSNAPAGEHVLRAKATDNLGASTWSEPVPVRVRAENAAPIVNLYAKDARASEAPRPDGGPDTATFIVARRRSTNDPVTVFLEVGGRAVNGVDYETIPTTVVIPAGQREIPIVVTPIDDSLVEPREAVVLRLIYPIAAIAVNYEIGLHPRAAALIADNDHPEPTPRPGGEPPAAAEALEDGVVHVVVIADLAEEVVVEGTDNLLDWFEIARGFMTDGRIDFVEAAALERAARFYRVVPVGSGLPVVDAQRVFGE